MAIANETSFASSGPNRHDSARRDLKTIRELIVVPLLVAACTGFVAAQTNELPRISAADATNFMGIQVVVTGKVVQVVHRATVVLLNLDRKYPESPLTCAVRGSDTNKFPDVEKHLGRQVEVTGRIIDYQGRPEIILTDTNQITVLDTPLIKAGPAPPATEPTTDASVPSAQSTLSAVVGELAPRGLDQPDRAAWWIVGSLAVIIALLAILVFLFWRRNPAKATQPVPTPGLIGNGGRRKTVACSRTPRRDNKDEAAENELCKARLEVH